MRARRLGLSLCAIGLLATAGVPALLEAESVPMSHLAVPTAYAGPWGSIQGCIRVNHQGTLFAGQPLEEMLETEVRLGLYRRDASSPLAGAEILLVVQQPAHQSAAVATGWKVQILEGRDGRAAAALSLLASGPGGGGGFIVGNVMGSLRSRGGRVQFSGGIQAGFGDGFRGGDVIGGLFGGLAVRLFSPVALHAEAGGNLETGFMLLGAGVRFAPNITLYFAVPWNVVRTDELETLDPEISGGLQYIF